MELDLIYVFQGNSHSPEIHPWSSLINVGGAYRSNPTLAVEDTDESGVILLGPILVGEGKRVGEVLRGVTEL